MLLLLFDEPIQLVAEILNLLQQNGAVHCVGSDDQYAARCILQISICRFDDLARRRLQLAIAIAKAKIALCYVQNK